MAASFQVNQPTEFTIKIAVTCHNGTVTLQPQVVPQQQQQSPLHLQQQTPRTLPATSPDKHISDLLRNFNSLSIQNNGLEDVAVPPDIASIDSQEPPAQLNLTKRRERNALRPKPVGIPNVPDTEDCPRQQRRERIAATYAAKTPMASGHPGHVMVIKGPPGGLPGTADGSTRKMMRGVPELVEEFKDESDDTIMRELLDDSNDRRRRQPSSVSPDSPYPPSGASSSPPASYASVPTPPCHPDAPGAAATGGSVVASTPPTEVRRRRGRPPKVRPDGIATVTQRQAGPKATSNGSRHVVPRPVAPQCGNTVDGSNCSVGVTDFVSPAALTEATRVITRYSDAELATTNDRGELLSHILAREGNWAKLMALNMRWLSNALLGDIFTSINTASDLGHTVLMEAALQQNLKALEYCCLFTSSSDVQLYRALVESSLLPSNEIFNTILQAMCHEMDENGNHVRRSNRYLDQPIGGWSFRNRELEQYAGLTLAQMLTVRPADAHPRIETLISYGVDPRRSIDSSAVERYRPYIDCVYLAAAFSPVPYECLLALGMGPDGQFPSDTDGEKLDWCRTTICRRSDLSPEYKTFVSQQLGYGFPVLTVDEVETILGYLDCD